MLVVRFSLGVLKGTLCLALLVLCSCGVAKPPLNPVLKTNVDRIELAKLEADNILLIRRVNPVFAAMGTSGLLLDAMIVADQASKYEKRAGPVNQMSINLFEKRLMQELSGQGFKVKSSGKRYWDYFKVSKKKKFQGMDAILRVRLKHMGFRSKNLQSPYQPSILVEAELIDPISRKVLYSDRFAMGMDITSLKIMEFGYGKITPIAAVQQSVSYKNFKELLSRPEQSRDALLELVVAAAQHVAAGFKSAKPAVLLAHDPQLFMEMPSLPLSTSLGEN